jgi:hypothetical protein
MDSDGSTVVAGSDLGGCFWGVALVAESLTPIGTYLHEARTFIHLGQRETVEGDVFLFPAVEQRE